MQRRKEYRESDNKTGDRARGKNLGSNNDSKVLLIQSIFVRHALGIPIPRAHSNLNSEAKANKNTRVEQMDLEPIIGSPEEYRAFGTAEVIYELKESKLKIKKTIPILISLEQDIFYYKREMDTIVKELKLNENEKLEFLVAHISENIRIKIKKAESYEEYFQKILKKKYRKSTSERYEEMLTRIKQSSFKQIKEYKNRLNEIIKRLKIADNLTEEEAKKIRQKTFFKRLHVETKILLAKENITKINRAIKRIECVEKILQNGQGKILAKEFKRKAKIVTSEENEKEKVKEQKVKAKTTTKTLNALENQRRPYINFKIEEEKDLKALYDTGATDSFINVEIVKELNLSFDENKETQVVKFQNGNSQKTEGEITLSLEIDDRTYEMEFLAMEMKDNMIIGYDQIKKHNIWLRPQTNKIEFDGKMFERDKVFRMTTKRNHSTQILKTKTRIEKKIQNYFQKVKKRMPVINEEFKITLRENEIPRCKNYAIPIYRHEKFKKELRKLQEEGVISPSSSQYGAPCFVKEKDNGDLRMLVDYRELNKITEVLQNTFPSVFESFHKLAGSNYFSKLDLEKGYYQISVKEQDRHKTAFITPFGKYEYNRIPMGLLNPPKYFHNVISRILQDIENTAVFVDDIIIFTRTLEEHEITMEKVLKRLEKKNIIINIKKNIICETKISYLGFIISEGGYAPDQERMEDFRCWEKPKTRKQLQKIIGKVNWYRPFIKDLSTKLKPFYEKLKGQARIIKVSDDEMSIIYGIYNELKTKFQLYFPDLNEPFFINTDASERGIGAVLHQEKGVVAYFSKSLNEAQQKYSVCEKECLAVLLASEKWHTWIGGSKITVYTDSKNLLGNTGNFSKKTERWKAELQKYDMVFEHIKGETNTIADDLSRMNALEITKKNKGIVEMQKEIAEYHITNGHPGQKTTLKTISAQRQLEPKESTMIKKYIETCLFCQLNKHGSPKKSGLIQGEIGTRKPLESISTDVYGPFEADHFITEDETQRMFCFTISDRASRFTMIKFTKNETAVEFIEFLKEWIKKLQPPKEILSDNGLCYKATETANFMKEKGITQRFATKYNPTGNSISERINSTITACLRIYKNWPLEVIKIVIENRFNTQYHSAIGRTPQSVINEFKKNPQLVIKTTQTEADVERMNKGRHHFEYQAGDFILKKNIRKSKLDQLYIGPYKIVEIQKGNQVIVIEDDEGKREKLNIKNVKPFKRR